MTTGAEINGWLDRLYSDDNLTHMIVVCDTYDYEDYPVYVSKVENVRDKRNSYNGNMQRVMEVYSKNHDRQEQLRAMRTFNYD